MPGVHASQAITPRSPTSGNGSNQTKNDQNTVANQPAPARMKAVSPAPQVSAKAAVSPQRPMGPQLATVSRPAAKSVAPGSFSNGQHPVIASVASTTPSPDTAIDDDSIPWEQIAAQTEISSKAATPRNLKSGS